MLKKISTSLFLVIYLSVSAVSFADEVVVEIVSEAPAPVVETVPEPVPEIVAPIVENIPEEIISETPSVEDIVPPVVPGDGVAPVTDNTSLPPEVPTLEENVVDTPQDVQEENVVDPTLEESAIDPLDTALEETTEEVLLEEPTTEIPVVVEVEENSVFTPPGPEPEPWQPAVREDPTTESNTLVGDTETQSDPAFLAENSVFVRRMIADVEIDPVAKHSCKVDVFRTDISDAAASTLSVKFYGISMLAAYDAEIGSLPNGIDVRFAKNNDYIYDFRGKETTLELVVNNQDGSLAGDFTIPIIYTHKGKKESTVICQLNIVNDEEETILPPVALPLVEPVVEPVLDSVQEFVEETPAEVLREPMVGPVSDPQPPVTVEEILEILVPEIPPVTPPITPPVVIIPKTEEVPMIPPPAETTPPEPAVDPVTPPIIDPEEVTLVPDPVPEMVAPVLGNPPAVEPTLLSPPDVLST